MFILIGFITLVSPTEKSQGSRPRRNVWNPDTDGKCSTYLLAMIILKRNFSDFPNSRGMCGEEKKKKTCFYPQTQQDLLFSTWPFPQTAVFLQCRSCLQLAKCSVSFVRQGKERERNKRTDCHHQAGRSQVSKKGKSKRLSVIFFFLAQNSVPTVSEAKAGCKQMNNWKAQKREREQKTMKQHCGI